MFASTTTIAGWVEAYGQGFYQCNTTGAYLRVAAGVNTDSGYVTSAHATAWAAMVATINGWFGAQGYGSRISAAGGLDAEQAWAAVSAVRSWAAGYGSGNGAYYDFGSADGCSHSSYATYPGLQCPDGRPPAYTWYQDDYWYVSWGAPAAFPLPEVYDSYTYTLPNGNITDYMANQWEMIRLYGYHYKTSTPILQGTMSTAGAISPSAAWTDLYNSVNAYSPAQGNVTYATYIPAL